tara:strand:- start:4302 stop:5411 length:1110 start_codon:yes stop_codon:yes gene_type:complete
MTEETKSSNIAEEQPPASEQQNTPPELHLSESFELALDQLKRSKNTQKKIDIIIPEALNKIESGDPQEHAEGNAILTTLAGDADKDVKRALARQLPKWTDLSPESAAQGALKMIEKDDRVVNIALAKGLADWIDKNPDAAEQVAQRLAEHKGMGVNLVLAESLPDWAEHHAHITGSIAKKLAKDYNHLNAVTNLLTKEYGEHWREAMEAEEKSGEKNQDNSRVANLFLQAGRDVERIKISLAAGLAAWAGHNPDDAEAVCQALVDEIKLGRNKDVDSNINASLIMSLSLLSEKHPKTTARLAAVIITNPDEDVISDVLEILRDNPDVDPNPAYDAIKDIDNYHGKETLERLTQCHDSKGEANLLDNLGL